MDPKQPDSRLVRLDELQGGLGLPAGELQTPNLVSISQKRHFGKVVGPQVCVEKVSF